MASYDIFISYRREGGKEIARPLKSELELRGYRVFLDFDELKDGKFDSRIMEAIENSPIFMVILSRNALDRCINEEDWVRKEIEYAIQKEKHIIPVNPDLEFNGFPDGLPNRLLEGLGQHQFSEVMLGQLFKESVEKLVRERIVEHINQNHDIHKQQTIGAIIHIETDLDCEVLRFGEKVCIVKAGEYTKIRLKKGKHKLEFRSIENPTDKSNLLFIVEDNDIEDFITVELAPIQQKRLEEENAKAEAERLAQEEAERIAKEEFERKSREEKERIAREETERLAAIEAEKKAQQERILYEYAKYQKLVPYTENNKYGFKDATTLKIAIPAQYDEVANSFSEGLAYVKLKNKYGHIDKIGKIIIPLKYNHAYNFDEGIAIVQLNGKWGCIDRTDKKITPFKYDYASSFWEGLAKVERNFKHGFIDKSGKEIIPLKYDYAYDFREGLAAVKLNDKWGYIDITGKKVIPFKFSSVSSFWLGRAEVETTFLGIKKKFYIDKNGNKIN